MRIFSRLYLSLSASTLLAVLTACSNDSSENIPRLSSPSSISSSTHAVIATYADDYSSSALTVADTAAPFNSERLLLPTISDTDIAGFGNFVYRFERFQHDNIAKFDAKTLGANSKPVWQFSTLGSDETGSSNVHDMAFVSENKAYLIRYGKPTIWIVNPSATKEEEFKIGEIDLSAFADDDGNPEMESGVVVGDKLYVALQRLDTKNGWIPLEAYVVVIDTTTDTVVDSKTSVDTKAIKLKSRNPQSIAFNEITQKIYIASIGSYSDTKVASGVEQLDPVNFGTDLIIDPNNRPAQAPSFSKVSAALVVDATLGYFVDYAGWGDNALYSFNPTNGNVGEKSVADLSAINIASITSDGNGHLWIGDSTNHQIVIVDIKTNAVLEKIDTTLNPGRVLFYR